VVTPIGSDELDKLEKELLRCVNEKIKKRKRDILIIDNSETLLQDVFSEMIKKRFDEDDLKYEKVVVALSYETCCMDIIVDRLGIVNG